MLTYFTTLWTQFEPDAADLFPESMDSVWTRCWPISRIYELSLNSMLTYFTNLWTQFELDVDLFHESMDSVLNLEVHDDRRTRN